MKKVVTFGELMLRLAPNGYYRFFQNDQMQATFGGGEANVAVSLANYGFDSKYVTKLPKHAIGQAALDGNFACAGHQLNNKSACRFHFIADKNTQ